MNLEHISHGLLDGKLFPHWEDPTAFTLEERELQPHVGIHSLRAREETWVVSGSQGSVPSECRSPWNALPIGCLVCSVLPWREAEGDGGVVALISEPVGQI